ncbi:MAM and LDL-receptor class A domain-containing protein 1-like [Mizuhopecten yessoensis]|uniref:MAM and LDL-receptor class A domain-containing protein 1-like n=1 Tax=Mizuhopecten yessoensis TaxID=6573 RepID=UPI000B45DBF5|nr:MAM and LDL-receptor class A domain-containing protein 1-like [Mizuhopecten yessoensis]
MNQAYKAQKDGMDSDRLTHEQKVEFGLESENPGEEKRSFVTNTTVFWPGGIVPYEISSTFSSAEKTVIETAIAEMATKTCVQFLPKAQTDSNALGHNSYISFVSESGCWSYVGRVFSNKQLISLQKGGCVTNSIAIHEMCHAIGQWHEQSRADRDNYVTMLWDNIKGGRSNINMVKQKTLDNNNYDHESVLQYSLGAFSTNGKPTMEFTDKRLDFLANSANGLTFYDVKDITAAYQCTGTCNVKLCENEGFQDHTCACYCPDGLKGDRCELVDTDSNCGGIIDVSGGPVTITSPNYPNNYDVNAQCTWLVKGGAKDYVQVDIDDLHLTDTSAGRCYHWLEVQYNLIGQTGPRRCGVVQGENYITSIDGYPNLMLLRFDSKFSSDRPSSKGFSLTVRSVGSGCATSPCVQGTCSTTSGNGFTCTCDKGFTGQTCNIASVSSSFSCSFEGRNCFLVQATDDNFDWTINSGSTPSTGTGPDSAQFGNNYLYAEGSIPRVPGDMARMSTNLNFPATDRCLRFWYFMYGNSVGQLTVAASGTTTPKANIWSLSGNQGQTWTQVSVNVPSTDGLQIYFETTRGSSWDSDIAIDTVELTPGLCLTENYSCTFENAECFLRDSPNDNYNWTLQTGGTPSSNTGPSSAHTGSNYIFYEVSSPVAPGETAKLETYNAIPAMDRCLSFWYHMNGDSVGNLQISTTSSGVLWTKSGDQGDMWVRATVNLPADPSFQLYIEATRGSSWDGDIALDDVELIYGTCRSVPVTCTFEDGAYCFLEQVNAAVDIFDWTINQRGTPSSNTGPDKAHTGSKYAFIETSYPRASGDNAILSSEQTTFIPMNRCLRFYFHMKGDSIGDLIVLSGERGSETTVWSLSGAQGNDWVYTEVSLPTAADLVIEIEGVRGSSWSGDIAIDDLELSAGLC